MAFPHSGSLSVGQRHPTIAARLVWLHPGSRLGRGAALSRLCRRQSSNTYPIIFLILLTPLSTSAETPVNDKASAETPVNDKASADTGRSEERRVGKEC